MHIWFNTFCLFKNLEKIYYCKKCADFVLAFLQLQNKDSFPLVKTLKEYVMSHCLRFEEKGWQPYLSNTYADPNTTGSLNVVHISMRKQTVIKTVQVLIGRNFPSSKLFLLTKGKLISEGITLTFNP